MKVHRESLFDARPEDVWAEVLKPALLVEVIRPLARVSFRDPSVPEIWETGTSVRCFCWIFGIIPIGERTISIESINPFKPSIKVSESTF